MKIMSIKKVVETNKEDKATTEDLFAVVNRIANISNDLNNATSNIRELKTKLDTALDKGNNTIKEEVQDLVNTIDNFKKNTITSSKEIIKELINISLFITLLSLLIVFYKVLGVKAVDYIYFFIMGFLGSGAGIMLSLYSIKKL